MTNHKLNAVILYIGMVVLIAYSLYRIFIGQLFPITGLIFSFGLAIALGFFATRQYMKFEEKKENSDLKERILEIPCPKCNSTLKELTSRTGKVVFDCKNGVIFCTNCKFEESKDEFDRLYLDHE